MKKLIELTKKELVTLFTNCKQLQEEVKNIQLERFGWDCELLAYNNNKPLEHYQTENRKQKYITEKALLKAFFNLVKYDHIFDYTTDGKTVFY